MISISETPLKTAEKLAMDFSIMANNYHNVNNAFYVALSGGSTPKAFYSILREKYQSQIHWENIHFYWVDERMVPSGHPDSNYGEAKRLLFNDFCIPESNIHPIMGDCEVSKECERYANLLKTSLPQQSGLPQFDLVLLGIGEDGHTASIFPDQKNLFETDSFTAAVSHPLTKQSRITLSGKVINNSLQVSFLVTGEEKSAVTGKIINHLPGSDNFPAAQIKPVSGNVSFYLDKSAASVILNSVNT